MLEVYKLTAVKRVRERVSLSQQPGILPLPSRSRRSNACQVRWGDVRHDGKDKGLFCYMPEKGILKRFRAPGDIASDDVSAVTEDKEGTIFVGTLTGGLFKLKKGNKQFQPIPDRSKVTLNIRTLLFNEQGRLLIGTDGEGLKEYDPVNNRVEDSEMSTARSSVWVFWASRLFR